MNKIPNFKLEQVPSHKVAFALTSPIDYEMERILLAQDWPDWSDYTLIQGWHCSCYDFDEAKWDAIRYGETELCQVLLGWHERGDGLERQFSELAMAYLLMEF